MPRSVSGNYTLPLPPVVPNTTIEAAWANTTDDDIAQALTDSLDRYGRGGMVAAFRLVDGNVGVPAWAFSAETSTGMYRESAGILSVSVQGAKVGQWSADGYTGPFFGTITGDFTFDGEVTFNDEVTFVGPVILPNHVGLGSPIEAWGSNFQSLDIGNFGAVFNASAGQAVALSYNLYNDGTVWRAKENVVSGMIYVSPAGVNWFTAPAVAIDAVATLKNRMNLNWSSGTLAFDPPLGVTQSIGVHPGGGTNSGYIEFYRPDTGVRGGYIGNVAPSAADAGTLTYVANLHQFTGNLSATGALFAGSTILGYEQGLIGAGVINLIHAAGNSGIGGKLLLVSGADSSGVSFMAVYSLAISTSGGAAPVVASTLYARTGTASPTLTIGNSGNTITVTVGAGGANQTYARVIG